MAIARREIRTPESPCQLTPQWYSVGRAEICSRSVLPALEEQGPVAHVGHEHRGRHGNTRPDAAPAAVLLWVLAITVTRVVGAPAGLVLVVHVLKPRLRVVSVDGTQGRALSGIDPAPGARARTLKQLRGPNPN